MSTTVTYKGSTLTTAENQTRTLKTSGKYLEDDITITDVTRGGSSAVIEALSVTANGTYSAPSGVDGYSPVTVNVSGGSGGSSKSHKDINFFDYDGTIVESFTASEWSSQTSLPSNPSHSGLTAQGWNYTKAEIDAEVTAQGRCDIGQIYITESGDTEIDIELYDGRLAPTLSICPKGTVEIDWGDGSAKDTVTGTSLTVLKNATHTYAEGVYTIKLHVISGSFALSGTSSNATGAKLLWGNGSGSINRAYQNAIKAVRLGNGITSISNYAFLYCYSLETITIPNSVTSIGTYAFQYCYSLVSITIPSGVTSISNYLCQYCYALTSVVMPSSIMSIGGNVFSYCYSLTSIAIPSGVTKISGSAFYYCYSLASTIIPSGITSIGNYLFGFCCSLTSIAIPSGVTKIGTNAFQNCLSLASITIPSGVTSIGTNAFNNCGSLCKLIFEPTTPPTAGGTNAFTTAPTDKVVYVPQGTLEAYQSATNYTNITSQMVEMP